MSSWDWNAIRAETAEDIEDAGTSAVLTSFAVAGDAFNPIRGEPTHTPVKVVVASYRAMEVDGSLVQLTDKKLLVAAEGLTITPDGTYQVTVNAMDTFDVVSVDAIMPAGTVVLYKLQGRRGG